MTASNRRVAVTGSSGYVGRQLIRRLESDDNVDLVLAIDISPPAVDHSPKVRFERRDVTAPLDDLLLEHRIDAVAHLAFVMNPGRNGLAARRTNVDGALNVLQACSNSGVGHLLYFSSSTVYGAHPDNPPHLTEDSPVRPVPGFLYAEHKVAVETALDRHACRRSRPTIVVLRSCPVMGPATDNFISRAFSKPFLVGVRGYDPPMQFVHEDDAAEVLAGCLLASVSGVYNMAGDGEVRWSEMVRVFGRRKLDVPASVLYPVTAIGWALGLQRDSPSSGLDFIRYPWVVDTHKLKRDLGITFSHTSARAWEAFALRDA